MTFSIFLQYKEEFEERLRNDGPYFRSSDLAGVLCQANLSRLIFRTTFGQLPFFKKSPV
jgi:hypothetical protein